MEARPPAVPCRAPAVPCRTPAVRGSRNLRDLGGYGAQGGRTVRWNRLYRSGSLAGLGPEGVEDLRALGLHGICDLRTSRERSADPYHWSADLGLSYWSRDYETSFGELRQLLAADHAGAEEAREAMLAGYRRLPFEQAPAYAELFRRLAAGELPVLFNCSAGKDRAGTAAALVLTALTVPRDTVIADYVLTDSLAQLETTMVRRADARSLLARQSPEVIRAILGCDPAYMHAALDAVGAGTPAFEAYLENTLGIGPAALESIRARLLA